MIFLSVTTLILGSAPPCGALDLDVVLALALERSEEVAIQQAERRAMVTMRVCALLPLHATAPVR